MAVRGCEISFSVLFIVAYKLVLVLVQCVWLATVLKFQIFVKIILVRWEDRRGQ